MTSIDSQLIETLKAQYEAIESKIQEIKNSNKLFSPSDFFDFYDYRDRHFNFSDVLTSALNHEDVNLFPEVKQKIHELQSLLLKEQDKVNLIHSELNSLKKEQEQIVTQLRSLFKDIYIVEFNKAYAAENILKHEVQTFVEIFKHCKSYKQYTDKFHVVFEHKVSLDEVINIIKNNYANVDPNFKGTITIKKADINFHNYQNYI